MHINLYFRRLEEEERKRCEAEAEAAAKKEEDKVKPLGLGTLSPVPPEGRPKTPRKKINDLRRRYVCSRTPFSWVFNVIIY